MSIDVYGIAIMTLILIPNTVFAFKNKDGFKNYFRNVVIEVLEQIGRFGCLFFMMIRLSAFCFGNLFDGAEAFNYVLSATLVVLYIAGWVAIKKEDYLFKSLALSIIPSILFLSYGLLSLNVPLIVSATIFAPSHILISYKNAEKRVRSEKNDNEKV